MIDTFSKSFRSAIMRSVKSSGNASTELRLIAVFRRNGIIGWRRGSKLPGRPDFVFARQKIVIFVDGDFWHGHPTMLRLPKTNLKYWRLKIARNIARDKRISRELRKRGWQVIRIWESELRNESAIRKRILQYLAD